MRSQLMPARVAPIIDARSDRARRGAIQRLTCAIPRSAPRSLALLATLALVLGVPRAPASGRRRRRS